MHTYDDSVVHGRTVPCPHLYRIHGFGAHTPSPPTKSLVSRGFDSSRLLILRGGNSHVR